MHDSCIAWSVCEAPNSEISICPWSLVDFWELVPRARLLHSALMQGLELGPANNLRFHALFKSIVSLSNSEKGQEWMRKALDRKWEEEMGEEDGEKL